MQLIFLLSMDGFAAMKSEHQRNLKKFLGYTLNLGEEKIAGMSNTTNRQNRQIGKNDESVSFVGALK